METTKFHLGYRFLIDIKGQTIMVAWISHRLACRLDAIFGVSNCYRGWSAMTRYHESDGFLRLLLYKGGEN